MSVNTVTVLCYHRVLPAQNGRNWPYFARGTAITAEVFEAHILELQRRFEVLAEEDVEAWLRGERELERPGCWLTFDDGYADNLEWAAPIAARHGVRPTLFVTTGVLQGGWRLPVDAWYGALMSATRRRGRLTGLGGPDWSFDLDHQADIARFMDGPEKRHFINASAARQAELVAALEEALGSVERVEQDYLCAEGLVELESMGWRIGAHSRTHQLLTGLAPEALMDEVHGSVWELGQVGLQRSSSFFAYPDGAWDARVQSALEQWAASLGLVGALTIDPRPVLGGAPAFSLSRFMVFNAALPDLSRA